MYIPCFGGGGGGGNNWQFIARLLDKPFLAIFDMWN